MSTDLDLICPSCAQQVFADDEFCEGCGIAVAEPRDRAHDHEETDAGSAAGVTDRGLVHHRNDDALFVQVEHRPEGVRTVAVVCDGVSTSAAPQVAAQLAADTIGRGLVAGVALTEAIAAADEQVRELSWMAVPGRTAPSCTTVAAVVDDCEILVAWAGDSRAYWVTTDAATQLTVDHSWAQEQIDTCELTPAQAATDRRAHMITRWLGDFGLDQGVGTANMRADSDGRLVLCSDGLWAHVTMADLIDLHRAYAAETATIPALGFVQALTAQALALGGTDNITVVVVDVDGRPPTMDHGSDPTSIAEATT